MKTMLAVGAVAAVAGTASAAHPGCAANGCTQCYRGDWGAPCFPGGGRAACEGEWRGVWCPAHAGRSTPPPQVTPPPATLPPVPTSGGDVIGFWDWTWTAPATPPPAANMAVSFSGWSDLNRALQDSSPRRGLPTLLDLGGGNHNGIWRVSTLEGINSAYLARVKAAGYSGIAYDVEECEGVIAPSVFKAAFQRTKAAGMVVLVSVSHSKPYGCSNGVQLMSAFIRDANVDIMNPQLYTTGNEARPDFTAVGTLWPEFKAKPASQKFVPSIGNYGHYPEVADYFARIGLPVQGFFQWQQNPTVYITRPPTPPATPSPPVTTTKAPVTTTEAPVTTTEAPVTTTKAPVTTTKAPATTTRAPVTTTEAPRVCRRTLRNWDDCRRMAADECCAAGRSCQGTRWWKSCKPN